MNSQQQVRYTSVRPPEGDCPDCVAIQNTRAFCDTCRGDRPCTWCGGRGWRLREGRWIRCEEGME